MNLTTHSNFIDQAQEKQINEFEKELIIHCQVEGKQSGVLNKPVTEAEIRAIVMNYVESQVQLQIDKNHQINIPVSGMVIANKVQTEARDKINPLKASLIEDEHKLRPLEQQKKECSPDLQKRLLRRCVYIGAALIAIAEGDFAYEAFRAALIPRIPAFFTALGVAVAIGFGSHFLGAYIQKAKTKLQRIFRYSIVLIPAFMGFYFLGNLRSTAYNQTVNLNSQINEISVPTGSVSGWSITIISFLLFVIALLFSIHVCKTEEECNKDREYDKICGGIKELLYKTRATNNTIDTIQKQAIEKAGEALARFEFAMAIENRLQGIAKNAMEAFKNANLRYRTDGLCPAFFSYPPTFNFRLFFDNLKTKQYEKNTFSSVA